MDQVKIIFYSLLVISVLLVACVNNFDDDADGVNDGKVTVVNNVTTHVNETRIVEDDDDDVDINIRGNTTVDY